MYVVVDKFAANNHDTKIVLQVVSNEIYMSGLTVNHMLNKNTLGV